MYMTADAFSLFIAIHSDAVLKVSNILHDKEHPNKKTFVKIELSLPFHSEQLKILGNTGIIRKADLMSVFARKQPFPNDLFNKTNSIINGCISHSG